MSFGTVAILGPGLIGGSLALALAERGLAQQLVIYSRKDGTFPEIAKKLPQARLTTDVVDAVRQADVVVLCVPVEQMANLTKRFVGVLKPNTLVTDVGSVKGSVNEAMAPLLSGKALWIGSHPMAGSEKSGFAASRPDLFVGATIIVTPTGINTGEMEAKARAQNFWRALGGNVLSCSPHEHDLTVAHVSHLPHLIAAVLVLATKDDFLRAAGPGFRDTTRVASGSPDLWTGIIRENRASIVQALAAFGDHLKKVELALSQEKESDLHNALQIAHDRRVKLPPKKP